MTRSLTHRLIIIIIIIAGRNGTAYRSPTYRRRSRSALDGTVQSIRSTVDRQKRVDCRAMSCCKYLRYLCRDDKCLNTFRHNVRFRFFRLRSCRSRSRSRRSFTRHTLSSSSRHNNTSQIFHQRRTAAIFSSPTNQQPTILLLLLFTFDTFFSSETDPNSNKFTNK